VPTTEGDRTLWVAVVALRVNEMCAGYPYIELAADPGADKVKRGFTYYNTVTNKVRTFDGTIFRDHW
jgi:hypothetical protein